jgi:predicted NUDIX family NTP pyrophosphohydrolase
VKNSAGILLYRRQADRLEVLLVHPGGPFWATKEEHAWSIPKGEFTEGEEPLAAAYREFAEETGFAVEGAPIDLGVLTANGKAIHAWAVEGDADPAQLRSNSFTMEWPPRSGKMAEFAEVDRAEWFDLDTARRKIHKSQIGFIDALQTGLM